MRPERPPLETPWVREQLIEYLERLSDPDWMRSVLAVSHQSADSLDEILNFLDDTGVVDVPTQRIGSILFDAAEAALLAELEVVLGTALDESTDARWAAVTESAGGALRLLR